MTPNTIFLTACALLGAAQAQQFEDDFDSYSPGGVTTQTSVWEAWDLNPAAANALVTAAQSSSAPHSLEIDAGDDIVHRFAGVTSGAWLLTTRWYVPSGMAGRSFLILLNRYAPGGPYSWSVQLGADGATGLVGDYPDAFQTPPATLPIRFDAWVEVRVEIDLDADLHTVYYDGQFLYTDTWSTHAFPYSGFAELSAIDLWSDGSSGAYWDDVRLQSTVLGGSSYCGPAIPNSSGQAATITASGSALVSANDVILTAAQLPAGQFGYFLAGQTQGLANPPGSQGFICLSGNIGRFNAPSNIIQGPTGSIQVDLTAIPVNPTQAVLPGETWNFQCWYRDNNPGQTSNFSDGIEILFL